MFNLATKSDLKELERDLRSEITELRLSFTDRMQRLEREMIDLRSDFGSLRYSLRWQIIVPSLTLIVSLVIHYIFH
jgi:hypothetical protein